MQAWGAPVFMYRVLESLLLILTTCVAGESQKSNDIQSDWLLVATTSKYFVGKIVLKAEL